MRDDLVDREHGVRRREDQIAAAARAERLGRAHLHRVGRDFLGLIVEVVLLRDFPARRARHARVVARPCLVADARGHAERRRRHEQLLLDIGALTRREVPPFVARIDRDVHARDALDLAGLVDDALGPGLLVGRRDRARILQHRRDVVLDVGRCGRQLDVTLLGDGAGARDFSRHSRDAHELVLGHDRAARESPDAAVDDAHAEPAGLPFGVRRNAAAASTAATAATESTAASASSTAARRHLRDRLRHHRTRRHRRHGPRLRS